MSLPKLFLLAMVVAAATLVAAPDFQPTEPLPVILDLPMDPTAAAASWEKTETLGTREDADLGRPVIHVKGLTYLASKEELAPPYELTFRARWTNREDTTYGASLYIGATTADPRVVAPAYRVMLRPDRRGGNYRLGVTVSRGNPIANLYDDRRPRRYNNLSATFMRRFENISPVWDVDFRSEIEAAMAAIPDPDNAWFRFRVVVRDDAISFFKDSVCIGEYTNHEAIAGRVILEARDAHLHIAELTARRLPADSPFQPVYLDSRVNATSLGAKDGYALPATALPAGGSRVTVNGVPFVLPPRELGDHIDVGKSLFHYRNNTQRLNFRSIYIPPEQLDANRILLSVPNRPYRRLWLLAANDGEAGSTDQLTVRFYRQSAGFPIDIPVTVTQAATADGPALIRVDLDSQRLASELREEATLAFELTKQTFPYTCYPDPHYFSTFQGGPPSAVRLFAATFEEAPVSMTAAGTRPGSVFVQPDAPVWRVQLANHTNAPLNGTLRVQASHPAGQTGVPVEHQLSLLPREQRTIEIPYRPERDISPDLPYGLFDVTTTFTTDDGFSLTEAGRFVHLPPDNRRTDENSSRWGLWVWHGGHGTNPDPDDNGYLMRAAGARGVGGSDRADRARWGLFPRPVGLSYRAPAWAFNDPDNQELRDQHAAEMVAAARKVLEANPDNPWLCYYLEDVASLELMFGEYPRHLGAEGTDAWTDEQKKAYEARFLAVKVAFEAIRKELPKAKLSLGWTHPQFQVPLLRMGFPKELFDAIGLDFPTFMRMPEMPLRDISPNRLFILKDEMKKLGYTQPIVHHETYFPSSQPLALGEQTGADYTVRFGVLSLALGTEKLAHCFSLHDCSDYWGSQHYGASGLVGKRPQYIPKPAYPAYATMTRLLDSVLPDGYVPTGSMSAYCVAFRNRNTMLPYAHIYALWTIRGQRSATVTLPAGASGDVYSPDGNRRPLALADGRAEVSLTPSPIWLTTTAPIAGIVLGAPAHPDNAPAADLVHTLGNLADGWQLNAQPYERLETNNPILAPFYAGPMETATVAGPTDGTKALRVTLKETPDYRPSVDWYTVFEPAQPVIIPGRAATLAIQVNGHSSWGRLIYEVEDAKGERWLSTGAPENWNGDDSRQRSYFNFDGWRWVDFPLPSSEPYDHYRGFDNVWWSYDQEGIVDLPLKLTKIVVTQRSHHVYVNELLPVAEPTADLGQLVAVYASPTDRTEAPILAQQQTAVSFADIDLANLPNPYRDLQTGAEGAPTAITGFRKPDNWYDGTQILVDIKPVDDVRGYNVYVSAYPDGTGATVMGTGTEPSIFVRRLRADYPLYVFVTWLDARRRESKPSEIHRLLLKDDFPNK